MCTLQVVMDFATTMPRGSTIVIIGNVTEYHEACLYARKKGLFVERILSADGLHRLAEACHANWMCSLANFLEAHGMAGIEALLFCSMFQSRLAVLAVLGSRSAK